MPLDTSLSYQLCWLHAHTAVPVVHVINRPISISLFVMIVLVVALYMPRLVKRRGALRIDADHDIHDTQ